MAGRSSAWPSNRVTIACRSTKKAWGGGAHVRARPRASQGFSPHSGVKPAHWPHGKNKLRRARRYAKGPQGSEVILLEAGGLGESASPSVLRPARGNRALLVPGGNGYHPLRKALRPTWALVPLRGLSNSFTRSGFYYEFLPKTSRQKNLWGGLRHRKRNTEHTKGPFPGQTGSRVKTSRRIVAGSPGLKGHPPIRCAIRWRREPKNHMKNTSRPSGTKGSPLPLLPSFMVPQPGAL